MHSSHECLLVADRDITHNVQQPTQTLVFGRHGGSKSRSCQGQGTHPTRSPSEKSSPVTNGSLRKVPIRQSCQQRRSKNRRGESIKYIDAQEIGRRVPTPSPFRRSSRRTEPQLIPFNPPLHPTPASARVPLSCLLYLVSTLPLCRQVLGKVVPWLPSIRSPRACSPCSRARALRVSCHYLTHMYAYSSRTSNDQLRSSL